MKIYTITLNPAYDIHAYTKRFAPFRENLAEVLTKNAGGKGVNISKALNSVGVSSTAVIVLGKENCAEFKEALSQEGINSIFFEKEGRIRENLTLHSENSPETRISFSGFSLENSIFKEIESKLNIDDETIVTFTGRIPNGISKEKSLDFLKNLKISGAKLVIDSKSLSLSDIYSLSPWLIKPNEEEISAYFESDITSIEDAVSKAQTLSQHGVENVMVSLGDKGALLITNGRLYKAHPPKINAVSTIGAGDSAIAGFISAYISSASPSECLKTAVSFGTAACLNEGTAAPQPKDIEDIYNKVK